MERKDSEKGQQEGGKARRREGRGRKDGEKG
jgi:hypothetical protein